MEKMRNKVLVVDDEKQIRDLLQKFLKREGYEVIVASDGKEAIELAKKERPEVVLLDIKLPKIDGIEVCRRLKADREIAFLPILMISAFEDKRPEAEGAGAEGFISKPVDLMQVSVQIKTTLNLRMLKSLQERVMIHLETTLANWL